MTALVRWPARPATVHRRGAWRALAMLGVTSVTTPAAAQEIGGFPLPDAKGAADIHDKGPPEHLIGSLQVPGTFAVPGVALAVEYTGEAAAIISGGNRKGAAYAGQLFVKADFDLGRIAGLQGLTAHVAIVNRHGRNASRDYLDDDILQTQEIYGGGGGVPVHLVYAYGEIAEANGAIDIAAGRLPVSHDFASSPLYCNYLTTLVCGSPHAIPGDPAFTIFPVATWGGRLRVRVRDDLAVQAGIYQVRPGDGGRSGFDWSFSGTGAYFPAEIDYLPKLGSSRLPGHYKLGLTYDTSSYDDLYRNAAGLPIAGSALPPLRQHGRASFYALADQMLARTGRDGASGISLFAGYVRLEGATARISSIAFAGVHALGVVPGRTHDAVDLLVGSVAVNASLERTQRLDLMLGEALAGGGAGVQTSEDIIEANYDLQVMPGLHVEPGLQYVSRPGATAANRSAIVAALKFDVVL